MKIQIAKEMCKGEGVLNSNQFCDSDFLNENQIKSFTQFIKRVLANQNLTGKNKPSWKNDNGQDIPNTSQYQQNNCWHYHSGPSYDPKFKMKAFTQNLEFNPDGDVSAEVIHYKKINRDTIFISVFSPKHIPFPCVNTHENPILRSIEGKFELNDRDVENIINELNDLLSD